MNCTKAAMVGDRVGEACKECGHTNLVHHGPHNPALIECVLCVLTGGSDDR